MAESEVLNELREIRTSISRLDAKITDTKNSLQDEIHSIRAEILEFQLKTQKLDEVDEWSKEFKSKITIADLERLRDDVITLKEFKTKSTVMFMTAQFLMAAALAWFTKG
jgi:DNA repair exonuclease SbcCD ATPase subunit